MKKILTIAFTASLFLCAVTIGQSLEAHYTRDVIVTKVKEQEITIQDKQGHQWLFNGKGYVEDQEITVIMYDNHTSNITDDKVVRVKQ